jgi:hypothetical protein
MTGESGQLVDAWIKRYEIIEEVVDEAPEANIRNLTSTPHPLDKPIFFAQKLVYIGDGYNLITRCRRICAFWSLVAKEADSRKRLAPDL